MNELLLSYEQFLSETKSKNTRLSYIADLTKFIKEAVISSIEELKSVDTASLTSFYKMLEMKGMAHSSILRISASLKKFFSFLKNRGIIEKNPALEVELPPIQRKLPNTLTSEQVIKLLESPDTASPKGIRDRAMLELMYATGAKVSEMISLKVSDVSIKSEIVMITSSSGKRVVPLGRAAIDAMNLYLKRGRPEIENSDKTDILFLNFRGTPLTRQGFWKIIKYYIEKAGISGAVTAQTLRHCFALHLLENGADAHSVSEMLGYSDVASTKIYMDVMSSRIKKVYKDAHPRA